MEFSNTQSSLTSPIFSPCSNYFATFSNNCIKDAACLDLKNHTQISFKDKDKNIKNYNLKFSPDSKLFAIKLDKRIQIYDINGNLKSKIKEQNHEVQQFVWIEHCSPYQLMVFYSGVSNCVVFNLQTAEQIYIKNNKYKASNGYAFSKGIYPGVFMAILQKHSSKDCIGFYYTKTWEMLNSITLQTFDANRIQFTNNGDLLVIENKINFKIHVVDPFRGVISSYGDKDYCLGVNVHKISNNQAFLALGVHDNCIHLLNTLTWVPICEIQMSETFDLSPAILQKEQKDRFIAVKQGRCKLPLLKSPDQSIAGISLLQFSPNDQYLAVKIDTVINCVFIYEIRSLELVTVIQISSNRNVRDFKWLMTQNNESALCIASGVSNLLLWKDFSKDQCIFEISVPSNDIKVTDIKLSKNGAIMLYSNSQKKYSYAFYQTLQHNDKMGGIRF